MSNDVVDNDNNDDVEHVNDDPLASLPPEDREFAKGWRANDPKGKTLEQFVADGKIIRQIEINNSKIKRMEQAEAARREADNKFHEARLLQLKREFADAVQNADLAEVTRVQQQIDLSVQQIRGVTVAPDLAYAQEWQSRPENRWVMEEDDPKAIYAKTLFDKALQAGKTAKQAIEEMEYKVNLKFPSQDDDKIPAPKTTQSRTPVGKSPAGGKLSMKDLTSDEKQFVKELKSYYKGTDDDILKMVERARAEQ
jgi:ribosomal protein S20